jgi:TolB-like protein
MLADSLAAQIKTKGKAPVAITSFVNSDYGSAFSNYVVDRLVVLLSKGNNDFDVVARDRVEETFKEMNLALARNYDSSTFAKVGKQLGAHSLIRGSYTVQSAAALVSIVAQIVDVETGRIIGGEVVETRLTGDLKAMLSSPDVGAPHLSRAVDQTRGAASTSGALPPVAPNAPRFQNDFLIATVDSVGFSRDTSGSYISLSVNFENRSTREELLMCVRRTLMDDQAREWEQSQGSGLAAMRNGYNYAYGPNGVAYSVSDHARFSPRVEQAAIMRFMRNGSPTESAGPSTVSLAMDCYRRRGDIDEPFSIAITRIPIGGGQAR